MSSMLLRACRSSLLRSSTAQRVRCLGAVSNSSTIDMNLGRTPERTAELEKLAEQHNGFLFGEVPLAEGESRQWEDWEYSYVPLMTSAFILYGLAFYYRPHKSMADWARQEALSRDTAESSDDDN